MKKLVFVLPFFLFFACDDKGSDKIEEVKTCGIGFEDCGADLGLQSPIPDAETTDEQCSDGLNNFQTKTKDGRDTDWFDCKNIYCQRFPLVQVCDTLENSDVKCSDGADNDNNNLIDCHDPSCFKNPRVTVCKDAAPVRWELGKACGDGKDNDGDNLADCQDPDCLHAGEKCDLGKKKRILFDASHHPTAGKTDWIIDVTGRHPYPSMPQKENDWHGGLSSFAFDLIKGSYIPETLPQNRKLTYKTSEVQDLKHYRVLVLPEPSSHFTAEESKAILDFVSDGGSLLYLANHKGAERDGNMCDSLDALEDLYKASGEKLAFRGDLTGANSDMKNKVANVPDAQKNHPVIQGKNGVVASVDSFGGTSFEVKGSVTLLEVDGKAYAVASTWGKGKIFIIGDSAISGDGTTSLGADENHRAYRSTDRQNRILLLNAVDWLAE